MVTGRLISTSLAVIKLKFKVSISHLYILIDKQIPSFYVTFRSKQSIK